MSKLTEWLSEATDINHESDDDAKGNNIVGSKDSTSNTDGNIAKVTDKAHDWPHETTVKLTLFTADVEFLIDSIKLLVDFWLSIVGLYHIDAGK